MSVKLLFLAGSARKDSLNKKLASAAYQSFDNKGNIIDENQAKMVHNVIRQLIETAQKLKA